MDEITQKKMVEAEQLRRNVTEIMTKVTELQMESNEHGSVLETLRKFDDDRKCFRLIGGVLVEQPAKEVITAVSTNQSNMNKLVETLIKQAHEFEAKADEVLKDVAASTPAPNGTLQASK